MMPANYTVRAQVVDIRTDKPRPTDRVFIDSNVWACRHYPGVGVTISGATVPQMYQYVPYIKSMVTARAVQCRAVASLLELAHLIERKELEAYNAAVAVTPLDVKEYRHNILSERNRLVGLIRSVWAKVEADSELLPLMLDASLVLKLLLGLDEPTDSYDLLQLEAMSANGVVQVLSDDGDFACVSGVTLFTSNPRVLAAAQALGLLLVR